MQKSNHARNVDGLRSHAVTKSKAVEKQIDSAIRALIRQNAAINFNAVATLAGVSKTTLYNNPAYRSRIEHLRLNSSISATNIIKHTVVTDKGKDVIIAVKNKRISELEVEVERLSAILKHCYANEYDKYNDGRI